MLAPARAGWARIALATVPARTLSIAAHLAAPVPPTAADDAPAITINGWVRSCRKQKNISFAVVNDGSNVQGIQAVVPSGMQHG